MKTTAIQSAPVVFEVCKASRNKVRDHFADFGKTFQLIEEQFKDHFPDVRKMVVLGSICMRAPNKAPKGRNVIAQGNAGNALGARIYRYPSPERAQHQESPEKARVTKWLRH